MQGSTVLGRALRLEFLLFRQRAPSYTLAGPGKALPSSRGFGPWFLQGVAPPAGRLKILVAPFLGLPAFSRDPDQRTADLILIRDGPAFTAWLVHSPCRSHVTELSAALPGARLCATALVPSSALLCQAPACVRQVCISTANCRSSGDFSVALPGARLCATGPHRLHG